MDYICPICLKRLDGTDQFERYCIAHKKTEPPQVFRFSSDRFWSDAHCREHNCRANSRISDGVFLRHVGCGVDSPFWQNGETRVAEDKASGDKYVYNQQQVILHWQIGAIRRLPSPSKQMWFPLLLLHAGAKEVEPPPVKPGGVMVGLAGAKGVGKTVLAMQALDLEGYVAPGSDEHIEIKDFIFCQSPAGGATPMYDTLYLRSVMERNLSGVTMPQATTPQVGDMKAVFFRKVPARRPDTSNESQPHTKPSRFRELFSELLEILQAAAREGNIHTSPADDWYAIAFYDTSGEDNEISGPKVKEVDEAVDKVAVVFDAQHLVRSDDEAQRALSTVINRLKNLSEAGKPCSLVITKLDAVLSDPAIRPDGVDGKDILEKIVYAPTDERTRLFTTLLGTDAGPNKNNLKRMILNNEIPVFFVWHSNLPTLSTSSDRPLKFNGQPVSYGLQTFICWCLGIEWEAVSQKPI